MPDTTQKDDEHEDYTCWSECFRCNAPVLKSVTWVKGLFGWKSYTEYTCGQCKHNSHIKD